MLRTLQCPSYITRPGPDQAFQKQTGQHQTMDFCSDTEGMGQGVRIPLKNHKAVGFLSNTVPYLMKNHQAPGLMEMGSFNR